MTRPTGRASLLTAARVSAIDAVSARVQCRVELRHTKWGARAGEPSASSGKDLNEPGGFAAAALDPFGEDEDTARGVEGRRDAVSIRATVY
jgi:hypothetical protein